MEIGINLIVHLVDLISTARHHPQLLPGHSLWGKGGYSICVGASVARSVQRDLIQENMEAVTGSKYWQVFEGLLSYAIQLRPSPAKRGHSHLIVPKDPSDTNSLSMCWHTAYATHDIDR